jgi:pimeloyl-ACP methyl ester carboxylesterase
MNLAAKIAGLVAIPAQLFDSSVSTANQVVETALQHLPDSIEKVERIFIPVEEGRGVQALLIYPTGAHRSNCIVYNHPNTNTLPYYLSRGFESQLPPFQLMFKRKCPVLLYDYRGTGISRPEIFEGANFVNHMPCVNTTSADAYAVLAYALNRFAHIELWGSSFGAGVATVACDAYLSENPEQACRIRLFHHDSFTRIGAVAFPKEFMGLASFLGTELDAEIPMRRLAARGVKIAILCHTNDPVIRAGARMAEILPSLRGKVRLIESAHYSHASLTEDMLQQI